jgi:hypothetical protein
MEKFSDAKAETSDIMIEDCVINFEPDAHDIAAAHGLPEHNLDRIADQIIYTVTHGQRVLDPIDYEMALRGLADKVRSLPEREKAMLRIKFGMS